MALLIVWLQTMLLFEGTVVVEAVVVVVEVVVVEVAVRTVKSPWRIAGLCVIHPAAD